MTFNRDLPRRLRSLFGTLTFLSLVLAGLAFGATWVVRTGLERDAVAAAGKTVGSVLEPELTRDDVGAPVAGDRYDELRALARKQIVTGPITSIQIWNADGIVVFADRRSLVGESASSMRETVRETLAQGSTKAVEGDTFRAFVAVRLSGDAAAVVELDRSMAAIAAEASDRWRPWANRAVAAAVACFALYLLAVGASILERRKRAHRVDRLPEPTRPAKTPAPPADAHVSVRRRSAPDPAADRGEAPAYMQPGFREQIEGHRETEGALASAQQALAASEHERARLQERLRTTEAELEEARRRLTDLGATAGR